ncbi:MAG TPA: NAD-dependent epimerase/dehydratase family protein, partial [Polyangiaceae bacterium]
GVVGSLENAAEVESAMRGMDTLVHLGAVPDDADFFELLGPNVVGLYQVMNAARAARLRRVVLASSMQVVSGLPEDRVATAEDRYPTNHYALTKLWAEQMGEMYALTFGLSVIAARILWVTRTPREARHLDEMGLHSHYLSRSDVARFFACAVEAGDISFAILYAGGTGAASVVDVETARRLIGYEPKDAWPAGLPFDLP